MSTKRCLINFPVFRKKKSGIQSRPDVLKGGLEFGTKLDQHGEGLKNLTFDGITDDAPCNILYFQDPTNFSHNLATR